MKKAAVALLAGLLLLIGVTAGTSIGLNWLLAVADRMAPGELSVGTASGSLLGALDLADVHYRDEALQLDIASVSLDWQPLALLRGNVHVIHARAGGVDVKVLAKQAPEPKQPVTFDSLPIAFEIGDFTVTNISVLDFGAAEPVRIDRIHLAGKGRDSELRLHEVVAESPLFAARLHGLLSLDTQQDGELATEWWVQLPDMPRLAGTGTVQGNGLHMQLQQTLSGPADVTVNASLNDVFEQLDWSASVDVRDFNLQAVQPEAPARVFAGEFSGKGSIDEFTVTGAATLTDPSLGETRATLNLSRTPTRWQVDELLLNNDTLQGELRINGEYASDGIMIANAAWSGLAWALSEQQTLRSPNGQLMLQGRADDYRFNGSGILESTGYPALAFTAEGTGNTQQVTLTRLQGDSTQGSFASSGEIAWSPAMKWQLQAAVDAFDPAFFAPDWPGKLSFRLDSDGQQSDTGLQGRLNVADVAGSLRGQPVSGTASASFLGDTLNVSQAQLVMGAARLSASGSISDAWDMQWAINAPDLGRLLPDAGGSLQGQGRVAGPRALPHVTASLDGKQLRLQGSRVDAVTARVDVDMAGQQVSVVDIKAAGVSAGGQTMDSVTLAADGRPSGHTLRLSAQQDKQQLTGRINAGLADQHWTGTLEELQLLLPAEQAWTLQKPSRFVIGQSRGELQALCLSNNGANICANGDWQSANTWQLLIDAGQLPLELVKPWLAPDVLLDGVAGLRVQARADAGGLSASAELVLNPGSVMLDEGEETVLLTRFGESRVTANLQNNTLTGELNLPLEENGAISGQLRIDQVSLRDQWFHERARITSTLALNLADRGLVSVFVPTLSTTRGQLNGDLVIGGTIGEPLLSGAATLKDAGVTVPQAGIQLRDVNMQVNVSGNTLDLQGSVTSGEGVASYQGQLTFQPGAPLSMDLALAGERVQVANIPEAMVLASPDLKISLREQKLDITGSMHIPEAQIRVRELKGVAKESGDLVLAEQDAEAIKNGKLQVAARINLVLADKVSFDGFGLTGKLDGKVEIIEQPGKVTRGQGELNIKEGQYAVYGQKLEIERGRLVFAGGPIGNPGLDMRVIRKSGEVLAGVRVTGTATLPVLALFSDPVMEQSDILSYLLLGIPTSKASGAQGAALSGAAASLGLAGGDWLSSKLGDAFGIDEAGVESGDTLEESSLVLGKYLSPRLYISYAVGLFDQLNTFRMRYDLSRRWSVQTEAGAATGADLLFTLER